MAIKKILLDTNFLIDVARFKIDLSELHHLVSGGQLCVIFPVIEELEKIAHTKTKESRYARAALFLASNLKKISVTGSADEALLRMANEKTIVATNDRELRKKLIKAGVKTIYLRAKKHLAIG